MKKLLILFFILSTPLIFASEQKSDKLLFTFGSSLGMGSFSLDDFIFDFGLNAGINAGIKYKKIEAFLTFDYTDFNPGIDGTKKYMYNYDINFTYKPFKLNKFNLFAGFYSGLSYQHFSKVWNYPPIAGSLELPTSKSLFMLGAVVGFEIEMPENKGDIFILSKLPLNNFLVWVVQSGFRFYF